jgi:hypothetical protein
MQLERQVTSWRTSAVRRRRPCWNGLEHIGVRSSGQNIGKKLVKLVILSAPRWGMLIGEEEEQENYATLL